MPAKVGDIVNSVINLLSQVPGYATQIYASGRILQHVQDALLLEIEEMWWPDYMIFVGPYGIDENGLLKSDITGPLGPITEWRDIARVFPTGSNKPLRELPMSINPSTLTGGPPRYISPSYTAVNRPFSVWPHDGAGEVWVWARQRPKLPLSPNDLVYIDHLLLQYDACWMYAVDDGTIPAQVNKFQVLAQNRRRMIKASFGQHPIELDPRFPDESIFATGDNSYFVLDQDPLA